ncbi:MAG TPA: Uma2 family endonuclease [Planctomycetales bacterium]|jgi:Uma2 family endonuclease|nr:Uma2 family endonuclease [Planctomycetales bacterium]
MSVITAAVPPVFVSPPAAPTDGLWRLSVDNYHAMMEAGILLDGDPVELLEGLLVEKMSKNPAHVLSSGLTRKSLERLAPADWFVNAQDPITTMDSEPEPDLSVVRGDPRRYKTRHPGPQDLALVVEVSDSTLQRDRTMKLRLYARAMIPIYWIVNLVEGRIEVYTDPTGPDEKPSYRQRRDYGPADEVPFIIEGRVIGRIAVRDLLP